MESVLFTASERPNQYGAMMAHSTANVNAAQRMGATALDISQRQIGLGYGSLGVHGNLDGLYFAAYDFRRLVRFLLVGFLLRTASPITCSLPCIAMPIIAMPILACVLGKYLMLLRFRAD